MPRFFHLSLFILITCTTSTILAYTSLSYGMSSAEKKLSKPISPFQSSEKAAIFTKNHVAYSRAYKNENPLPKLKGSVNFIPGSLMLGKNTDAVKKIQNQAIESVTPISNLIIKTQNIKSFVSKVEGKTVRDTENTAKISRDVNSQNNVNLNLDINTDQSSDQAINQEIKQKNIELTENIQHLISEKEEQQTKFEQQKQDCFQKFWVENCIKQLSSNYYKNLDALNQKIHQFSYEKRISEFDEKQRILALKSEKERDQIQNEDRQILENQSAHQIKLQFLNPNPIIEKSARNLNAESIHNLSLDREKAEQISKSIREQITNAPVIKPLPPFNLPAISQNLEKFEHKQQKVLKKQTDLNSRIKNLDDFVKKYQTP